MLGRSIIAAACLLGIATTGTHSAAAAGADDVERFTATTINLDPAGVALRFDVLTWSDTESAAAVLAALESEALQKALDEIPTAGYVWPEGSPVGYSIKYARKDATDNGERLTFVTSKRLGSFDFGGWTVHDAPAVEALEYSVIELDLPASGTGSGMASLATPVVIDAQGETLRLNRDAESPELFAEVRILETGY
jgi:hypothetical protein